MDTISPDKLPLCKLEDNHSLLQKSIGVFYIWSSDLDSMCDLHTFQYTF